jgi:hypothetical protein
MKKKSKQYSSNNVTRPSVSTKLKPKTTKLVKKLGVPSLRKDGKSTHHARTGRKRSK